MYGRNRLFAAVHHDVMIPHVSKFLNAHGFRPHYPENKKFAVCISHDIDYLYHGYTIRLTNLAEGLRQRNISTIGKSFSYLIRRKIHGELQLQNLLNIHRDFGIRSSYYFLSLMRGEEDFNYEVAEAGDQIKMVLQEKNEVGLHGGHRAFNDRGKIEQEKRQLEKIVGVSLTGYRNHALRFQTPDTWQNLKDNGFVYDTTFGYPDCAGFRNGMCFPFVPLDSDTGKHIDLVEVPLIAMDATFFNYMKTDANQTLDVCKFIIDQVKECGGVFTLLWHNNFVTGKFGDLYKRLLDYVLSQDPWIAPTIDVVNWWKSEGLLQQSSLMLDELQNRAK
jgi:hypothetical protein